MTNTLENKNTKVYNKLYKFWEDGWEEQDKKFNFQYLFKIQKYTNKEFDNSSLLDVGCGTGDIVKYLPETTKYVGIDIYLPALQIAKEKYPDHYFKYGNILNYLRSKHDVYDFVICSGALTLNLSDLKMDNYEFLTKSVKRMWKLCKYGVAFNILSDEKYKKNDTELYHYNIEKLKDILIKNEFTFHSLYTPLDADNDQHTFYLTKRTRRRRARN